MAWFRKSVRGWLTAALIAVGVPLFGAGVALTVAGTAAEAAVVRSIVVQGNQRVDAETIRNYVTITPGQNFGADDIDASLKTLYSTGLFADVRITQNGNSLVVTVQENPVVISVRFEGNKKYKTDNLAPLIETKPRSMLSESKLEQDARRIEEFYARAGRSTASVTTAVTQVGENRVNVVFTVDEGGKTGISQIEFIGNDHYSDRRLRSVIQTRKTNLLSWFNQRDIYDEARIDADQEMLRRFYLSNGFADFRVVSVDSQFDEDKKRYFITVTVEEGPRYKFGAIEIDSSISEISSEALRRYVRTRSGNIFDATAVEKTIEDITVAVSESGYAFAQVRPRGDRDYTNNTINVTYVIDEGSRVYIERINVLGNNRTRDYVIRREFDLAEGDPYNRVMVDAVERRLRRLDYFKSVQIGIEPGSAPDKVILNVLVEEKSTGEFSVSGGYSTDSGFIAELSMTERNFLGRGQYIRVAVGGGLGDTASRNIDFKFVEPYFLGRRMPVGLEAYRRTTESSTNRPFDREMTGGSVWVGLPITDELEFKAGYKFLSDSISNSTVVPASLYPNGDTMTSSVFYNLTYSSIDNMQDPSKGLFAKLDQEFAGVGGDVSFVRTIADARYYRPIMSDSEVIGMLRATGGNITGIGENVRIFDNFFKGGETIRGFASYGYGPTETTGSGLHVGGKNYWATTAELQFPMPFMPEDFGVRAALFADAGSLFGVDSPGGGAIIANNNTIRSSAGFSILWNSPFGLLRGDVGFPLTKAATDDTQLFRFSAGTQF